MAGHLHVILVTLLAASAFAAESRGHEIIYVNASATGANDGTSWTNAYLDLQDALDDAAIECGDTPCEIWVAGGTYKPDRGTGDPMKSFELVDNVALYGGFGGWESSLDERDPAINETVLLGDLLDNDDPNFVPVSTCCYNHQAPGCDDAACQALVGEAYQMCLDAQWYPPCASVAGGLCCELCAPDRCDNTHHVVVARNVSAGTVLDGFIVASGATRSVEYPDVAGAGLLIESASPTIRNCVFRDNWSCWNGGGGIASLEDCYPILDSIHFLRNRAHYGGGIMCKDGCSLTNCSFTQNAGYWGAALYSVYSVDLLSCTFDDNERLPWSSWTMCAVAVMFGSATIVDSVFSNHSDHPALYANASSLLVGCTFENNSQTPAKLDESSTIIDSAFRSNSGSNAGAVSINYGLLWISDCVFEDNASDQEAGALHIGFLSRAHIERSVFRDNRAVESGGAIESDGAMHILDSLFERNSVTGDTYGGGAIEFQADGISIDRCVFRGNSSMAHGGAILTHGYISGEFSVRDSVFSGNESNRAGGGIFVGPDTSANIQSSTFYHNSSGSQGGGLFSGSFTATNVRNSIFRLNRDESGATESGQLKQAGTPYPIHINYSTIQGWTGFFGGNGNIDDDPLFLDSDGPDDIPATDDDDFQLSPDSPCIDAGDPAYAPTSDDADLDGHARVLCGRVDIGAYEFGIGDYNCDRVVELVDFAQFPNCLTGPAPEQPYAPACAAYDFATEVMEDIDLRDFAGLQNSR